MHTSRKIVNARFALSAERKQTIKLTFIVLRCEMRGEILPIFGRKIHRNGTSFTICVQVRNRAREIVSIK